MEPWPGEILAPLARTSGLQLIALGVLWYLLRGNRLTSTRTCRLACFLVLLQGCLFVPFTFNVPWYDVAFDPLQQDVASGMPSNAWHTSDLADADAWATVAQRSENSQQPSASTATMWATTISRVARGLAWVLLGVWIAGVLVLTLRQLGTYVVFVCQNHKLRPAEAAWQRQHEEILSSCGVARRIPLLVSDNLGPMLCWLPRGHVVIVPERFWRDSTEGQRRTILLHEMAHYCRGDLWKSWLITLLAIPNWFNPLVWWAVSTFRQSAERACDRSATDTPASRLEYIQALQRLALRQQPVHAVGQCAHSHPLVSRVRFLLNPAHVEEPMMRKALLLVLTVALFVVAAVRVQLVAKEVSYTKDTALAKVAQLDRQLSELIGQVTALRQKGAELQRDVVEEVERLEGIADPNTFSDETKRRFDLVMQGDEKSQLNAIDGAAKLGDEGVMLLGYTAAQSDHQAVRRAALAAAAEMGKPGFPVLAYALERLGDEDRLFLAKTLVKQDSELHLIALALLAKYSDGKVQEEVVKLGAATKYRVPFVTTLASAANGDDILRLIELAATFEGDDGVLLLYAACQHGNTKQKIAAMEAASQRGQEGLPVLAPALAVEDPEVRTTLVRCANRIGGDVAQMAIDMLLADDNQDLRKAAEEGLEANP